MMVIEVHEVFFNNSFAKNFSEYLLHYIQTSLVPFNLILYPLLFSKLALTGHYYLLFLPVCSGSHNPLLEQLQQQCNFLLLTTFPLYNMLHCPLCRSNSVIPCFSAHKSLVSPCCCSTLSRFSCAWLSATPWTVAHQPTLYRGFFQ